MDEIKWQSIHRNRQAIVADLDVNDIASELYSNSVLTKSEYSQIQQKKERKECCEWFLDQIRNKGGDSYEKFMECLHLPYPWLYDAVTKTLGDPTVQEDIYHEMVVLGNFPKLPPNFIVRTSTRQELQEELVQLKNNETLILHGMALIGKSCLVVSALEDKPLVHQNFGSKVFWVNLAEVHDSERDKDLILNEMYRLLLNLGANDIGISEDTRLDLEIPKLQRDLKKAFLLQENKRSLLILDNVRCSNIVEYFDLGCKILATTSDISFIRKHDKTKFMKMNHGFSEKESVALFSKCLGISPKDLPNEVKQIHSICKGYPMLIALIGSFLEDNRESGCPGQDVWSFIIDNLNNYNELDEILGKNISNTLNLCINKLNLELRKCFQDLAVFPEDVNMPSNVLRVLWNKTKFEVRRTMLQLEKKSLVMSFFNKERNEYVYGIHPLLLSELRKSVEEPLDHHKSLIKACEDIISEGKIRDFKEDDYLLQYFGYHLEKAGLFEKFAIYFDLNFIGVKIQAVGYADLLRDYQIYRKYITRNDMLLERKLEQYEKFVNENGYVLHNYPYTNIIQTALQQPSDAFVYNEASNFAKANPDKLYLDLKLSPDRHYFTHFLKLPYKITAACFTNNTSQVLVGTETGKIIMWEQHYCRELYTFDEHLKRITSLVLSPDRTHFLSVSDDRFVKLWKLPIATPRNSLGSCIKSEFGSNEDVPSPSLKQKGYHFFSPSEEEIGSCATFRCRTSNSGERLTAAAFANNFPNTKKIATISDRAEVIIWDTDSAEKICHIGARGVPGNCLTFSWDDEFIIFNCKENILVYNSLTGHYIKQFNNQNVVNLLVLLPPSDGFQRLVAVSDSVMKVWKWKTGVCGCYEQKIQFSLPDSPEVKFTCAAVTKDGCYLVAGSTDSFLRTWDVTTEDSGKIIEHYNDEKVICLDTYLKDSRDSQVHILLVASENKTLKQWYVHSDVKNIVPVKNFPDFDTFWPRSSSFIPRIAIANEDRKIQILNGEKLLTETYEIPEQVRGIRFSPDGDKIVYGLASGEVFEFNVKTRKTELILNLKEAVLFLECFERDNSKIVLAATEGFHLALFTNSSLVYIGNKDSSTISFLKCFYLKDVKVVLTVSRNRMISAWSETGEYLGNLIEAVHLPLVSCRLSCDSDLLACCASNSFEVFYLRRKARGVELELLQKQQLDGKVTCCCFSFDGQLLAFGRENGVVVIWDLKNTIELTQLSLHQSNIRQVEFSPGPDYILVTLAEQIAWWNIAKLQGNQQENSCRRVNGNKKGPKNLDLTKQVSAMNLGLWNNKLCHEQKDGLLATIKFQGAYADRVAVSPSFGSFVAVDNLGKVYVMKVLDNF